MQYPHAQRIQGLLAAITFQIYAIIVGQADCRFTLLTAPLICGTKEDLCVASPGRSSWMTACEKMIGYSSRASYLVSPRANPAMWQGSALSSHQPIRSRKRHCGKLLNFLRTRVSFFSAARQGHSIRLQPSHCATSVSWPVFLNLSFSLSPSLSFHLPRTPPVPTPAPPLLLTWVVCKRCVAAVCFCHSD